MSEIDAKGYKVLIEKNSFKGLSAFLRKSKYSSVYIICDENTFKQCLPLLILQVQELRTAELIEVEAGEASKTIDVCSRICETLLETNADRNALLICLGGGMITDLGGFTASVYKRGISFIHLPTSLLAMADASIGGKTGLDLNGVKNVIGTFAKPAAVFIHTAFLNTLPKRHFKNGLSEIYKIALVRDITFWKRLKKPLSAQEMIERSVFLKNKIVLRDPLDAGSRKILNFGHTIGHALESLLLKSKGELLHGEAIRIGMIIESHLALQKKMISEAEYSEIVSTLSTLQDLRSISAISFDSIFMLLFKDKKTTGGKIRFSLLNKIGSCTTDVVVSPIQIKKAIAAYNTLVHDHP